MVMGGGCGGAWGERTALPEVQCEVPIRLAAETQSGCLPHFRKCSVAGAAAGGVVLDRAAAGGG